MKGKSFLIAYAIIFSFCFYSCDRTVRTDREADTTTGGYGERDTIHDTIPDDTPHGTTEGRSTTTGATTPGKGMNPSSTTTGSRDTDTMKMPDKVNREKKTGGETTGGKTTY